MQFTRTSKISGIERTLDLPVTPEQVAAWESGLVIQEAMPDLTDAEREFIITGITDEEWDATFLDRDDDDDDAPDDDAEPVF